MESDGIRLSFALNDPLESRSIDLAQWQCYIIFLCLESFQPECKAPAAPRYPRIAMRSLLHRRKLLSHLTNHASKVERVMGIEPTFAAWEAAVLPLDDTRFGLNRH